VRMRFGALGLVLSLALAAQPRPNRITPENVGRLGVLWTYDTRESTEPLRPGTDRPAFEATPVYSKGHLYLSTPGGLVIALDAETGTEVWRVDLKIRRDANYSDFASRGVTVVDDLIYAASVGRCGGSCWVQDRSSVSIRAAHRSAPSSPFENVPFLRAM
jgi:quinoprotein glucose dehydrogenase